MSDDKKEPWLNYLALTTVILAVCATLSTFKGGGYSIRSMMSQSKASDQWAFYQAKSVKSNLYDIQKDLLSMEQHGINLKDTALVAAYRKKIEDYGQKVTKYENEKVQIQQVAHGFEADRDDAQKHSKGFGLAVIFLQIAILLSSIAALLKKKPVWVLGLIVGVVGVLYFVNGFVVWF